MVNGNRQHYKTAIIKICFTASNVAILMKIHIKHCGLMLEYYCVIEVKGIRRYKSKLELIVA